MNNLEIRVAGQFEKVAESRTIRGLAIPVESQSELLYGEFYETILRSAITDELISSNDIKLYVNHDASQGTFARSKYGKGSLRLFVTEAGLEFETELPDTEKGNELLRGIERGDYDAISFGFIVGKEHFSEKPNKDGTWNRYIESISMLDEISILSVLPAYSSTNVNLRSLEEAKQAYEAERIANINKQLDAMLNDIEELAKVD